MKTFDDLVFEAHPNTADGLMARLDLGHYQISVVTMKGKKPQYGGLYGSQVDGTYEVAVFRNTNSGGHDMIHLSEWDDVLGWQTPEEITAIMAKIQDGLGASLNQPEPAW
jgi:hypothetical protein